MILTRYPSRQLCKFPKKFYLLIFKLIQILHIQNSPLQITITRLIKQNIITSHSYIEKKFENLYHQRSQTPRNNISSPPFGIMRSPISQCLKGLMKRSHSFFMLLQHPNKIFKKRQLLFKIKSSPHFAKTDLPSGSHKILSSPSWDSCRR